VGDIDSAGVYFLSVEEFESRSPARSRENHDDHDDHDDPGDEGDQPEVDSTKAAITPPSSSPTSS
jgi:hypothetical protein